MSRRLSLAAMLAAALLSGCSGEPGESDIREALQRNQMVVFGLSGMFFDPGNRNADTSAMARKFLGEATVKIDGCSTAQSAPGFVCDFRLGRLDGAGLTPPMKGRFFKADDGWQFEQMR